ncbi:MAG: CHASE domain-containing protein, partial [Gammaproteobacteria bacterium]|nr:CHASE domain-containing protein [Gammaproteobacteria bacterium]
MSNSNKSISYRYFRYLPAVLTLLIGLTVSFYLLHDIGTHSQQQAQSIFQDSAQAKIDHVESLINLTVTLLNSMAGLYNSSQDVARTEFEIFVRSQAEYSKVFRAIEWVPVVSRAQRSRFEKAHNLSITELSPKGDLIPASNRDIYYPITYVEPIKTNKKARGYDLGSNPDRLEALYTAIESGSIAVTAPISLVQKAKQAPAVLLAIPIYKKNTPINSKEMRMKNILGFVIGVVEVSTLFQFSQDGSKVISFPFQNIKLSVFDTAAQPLETPFYSSESFTNEGSVSTSPPVQYGEHDTSYIERDIAFGNRIWKVLGTPGTNATQNYGSGQAYTAMFSSFLTTMALVVLLVFTARRGQLVEHLAEQRAMQLKSISHKADKEEAHMKAVVENSSEAIITIDTVGTIISANPATETIFGYERSELIGKNVSTLIPQDKRDEHAGYLRNSTLHETRIINQSREIEGLRKDGTRFPIELSVSRMELHGRAEFIGIIHEISDRKEAERLKTEFISIVSHELRTPITSIKGALGLLLSGAVVKLPEQVLSLVDISYKNCDRQIRLVNDLLDMEKMAAGKMEYTINTLDLLEVIQESVAQTEEYARTLDVSISINSNLPSAMIKADPGRIIQVITNLLSNAIKFSPKEGIVNVLTTDLGDQYKVEINDQGPGISP